MAVNTIEFRTLCRELGDAVTLVAVSKTKPVEDILALYEAGQRDFGENYVQEMLVKARQLPADIRWHFIGHLQTNKVKLILPVVQLIHGVDSLKLLKEISKEAVKSGRTADCLLQVHIAEEETKFGLDAQELEELLDRAATGEWKQVRLRGLMGMASFTADREQIRAEFNSLKKKFDSCRKSVPDPLVFDTLSMGMSGDFRIAIEEGSNMVRIGSLLFGERVRK